MRKFTSRLVLSGILGAFAGAIIIILVLSMIGAGYRGAGENVLIKTSNTENSLSDQESNLTKPVISPTPLNTPKSSAKNDNYLQVFTDIGIELSMPSEYRVASKIMAMDKKYAGSGTSTITITKGTEKQEIEYVKLVENLKTGKEGVLQATELPQFLSGQTILISVTNENASISDSKLARGKEAFVNDMGIPGVRYIKVEGINTYDSTYFNFPNNRIVSVQMEYNSVEPLFDEVAYKKILNSIRPQVVSVKN